MLEKKGEGSLFRRVKLELKSKSEASQMNKEVRDEIFLSKILAEQRP